MLRLRGLLSAGRSGTATAATFKVAAVLVLVVAGTGAVRSQLQQPVSEPARPVSDTAAALQIVGSGAVTSVDELVSDADAPVAVPSDGAQTGEGSGFVAAVSVVLRSGVAAVRNGIVGAADLLTEPLRGTTPPAESAEDRAPGVAPPPPDEQRARADRRQSPVLAPIVSPEAADEAAAVLPAPTPPPAAAPGAPAPPVPSGPQFFISGAVSGLHPGSSGLLELTITNPHAFVIDVVLLTVAPEPAPAGCTTAGGGHPIHADDHTLSDPPIRVPAGGAAAHELPIRMALDAGDGCQGKRFALRYHGQAVQR